MTRCKLFGLVLIPVLVVALLSPAPAFAERPAVPAAAPQAASASDLAGWVPPAVTPPQAASIQPGCASALDLAAVLSSSHGEICPATLPDNTPEFMARPPRLRTCVCSCGYPCETDADCGPGGNCGPGITCC